MAFLVTILILCTHTHTEGIGTCCGNGNGVCFSPATFGQNARKRQQQRRSLGFIQYRVVSVVDVVKKEQEPPNWQC